MAVEEDSVDQVLAARQERLRALKAAQELLNTPDEDSAQAHDNTNENNAISDEADVQKRLDKLEKRTQKAMLKLMGEQEKQKVLDGDGGNGGED